MQRHLPPNRELVSDKPGMDAGPGGDRHGVAPTVDYHEFEKERFAHQVAQVLNKARAMGRFDRLVLVAPPKALGHLRDELDKQTRGLVTAELDKDLTHAETRELTEHLGEVMAV
jgi:protein required for attachment to host cells